MLDEVIAQKAYLEAAVLSPRSAVAAHVAITAEADAVSPSRLHAPIVDGASHTALPAPPAPPASAAPFSFVAAVLAHAQVVGVDNCDDAMDAAAGVSSLRLPAPIADDAIHIPAPVPPAAAEYVFELAVADDSQQGNDTLLGHIDGFAVFIVPVSSL